MKANRFPSALLVLLAVAIGLRAQQTGTNAARTTQNPYDALDAAKPDYGDSAQFLPKPGASNLSTVPSNAFGFVPLPVQPRPTNAASAPNATNRAAINEFDRFMAMAKRGNALAQTRIGMMYAAGKGVPLDLDEAAKWFRQAADQGYADAQYFLGLFYYAGSGVPQNRAEAATWWRKAAKQGNANAQFNLADCYYSGEGVVKDEQEAVKWYRKAAQQNDARSQFYLADAYFGGHGVAKDFVESYKWALLGAAQGDENIKTNDLFVLGKKYISLLEGVMTPDQIAEGQRLARNFKPLNKSTSDNSASPENPTASGTGFFISDDGYLISNYHVVKDAAKVRLLTGTGLIDAKVVKVDKANDLAMLKAEGRFAPLPVAASRGVTLGGTVATVGFPDIGL